MKRKFEYSKNRMFDFPIDCDICGQRCWYSESTLMGIFTGRGGLLVCNKHNDKIDYGLVPYPLTTERGIPTSRVAISNVDTGTNVWDSGANDPMNSNGPY